MPAVEEEREHVVAIFLGCTLALHAVQVAQDALELFLRWAHGCRL